MRSKLRAKMGNFCAKLCDLRTLNGATWDRGPSHAVEEPNAESQPRAVEVPLSRNVVCDGVPEVSAPCHLPRQK